MYGQGAARPVRVSTRSLSPSALADHFGASRIKKLLAEFSLEGHPMTTFETGEGDSKHVGDDYFLESADKVSSVDLQLSSL